VPVVPAGNGPLIPLIMPVAAQAVVAKSGPEPRHSAAPEIILAGVVIFTLCLLNHYRLVQ
jgi:hypothetical protein